MFFLHYFHYFHPAGPEQLTQRVHGCYREPPARGQGQVLPQQWLQTALEGQVMTSKLCGLKLLLGVASNTPGPRRCLPGASSLHQSKRAREMSWSTE